MSDKFEWPRAENEADKTIIRNARKHGCHIVGIVDGEPPYDFSIGLFVNYGHAEVIVFGLRAINSASLINGVRDRAARGQKFRAGDVCDDLLVGHSVCFVEVPLQLYGDYLGMAIWFYRKSPRPFPCLQIVWPDRNGRFPWQTGYDASLRRFQPLLRTFS